MGRLIKSTLSEEEKKWFAFVPLATLISKRKIYKSRVPLKILKTTADKYELILNGEYASLERDEMIQMTASIICHYFWKNEKKLKNERRKQDLKKS